MTKKSFRLTLIAFFLCTLLVFFVSACQPKIVSPPQPSHPTQGVLNLWDIGPITLDPAVSSEMTSHSYILQIFSGLVKLDPELKPVPDIAERWQKSPDGKTYTFFLRRNVKFHSGRSVTASDFKYSWERACDPKTGSLTAATYLGDIVGVKDVLEGKAKEIKGVKVIDDYTLEVTIDAPKAYFLLKLTYPTSFVVNKANVESGTEWWRKPDGTGAFKLKEWQPDNLLVLEANEFYYDKPARVKQVNFYLWGGRPIDMYEMGKIDVSPVYQDYIDRVRDKFSPFYQELIAMPELSLYYIGFNTKKPPFDDINIRRAFSMAIDKQRIIDVTLKGMVVKASGILPPGMPGYNKNLQGLEYNIIEAQRLIATSKYGDPSRLPPITLTISGWGGNIPDHVRALVYQWQQNLGVKITIRQLEPENFFYNLKQEKDDLFLLGWVADYPDPQNFLDNLFYTGSEHNYGEYSNPELDSLLNRAAIEPDEAVRLKMYQEAELKLVAEAPILPLWFNVNYVLVKPYVKGYKLTPLGIPDLSQVYIQH